MKRQPWALYAVALAILVVGLVAVGVPVQTLLFAALVLACPLMMIFMHSGHDDHHKPTRRLGASPQPEQHEPTSGMR